MFNSRTFCRKTLVSAFSILGLTAKRICAWRLLPFLSGLPTSSVRNVAVSIRPFSSKAAKTVDAKEPKIPCASSGSAALFSCTPKMF